MADALSTYLFSNEVLFFYPEPGEKKSTLAEGNVNTGQPAASAEPKKESIPAAVPQSIFNKPLLVLIQDPGAAEKDLLFKILKSVNHSQESVVMFDVSAGLPFPSEDFFKQQQTRKVLSFGVAVSRIDPALLVFPYQKKNHRQIDFLMTDSLSAISLNQKDEKKLLWVALKEMFL